MWTGEFEDLDSVSLCLCVRIMEQNKRTFPYRYKIKVQVYVWQVLHGSLHWRLVLQGIPQACVTQQVEVNCAPLNADLWSLISKLNFFQFKLVKFTINLFHLLYPCVSYYMLYITSIVQKYVKTSTNRNLQRTQI